MRDRRKRTLQTLQADRRAWADATFPNQPVAGLLKHLRKEVNETIDALESPNPPEAPHMELADILLLLVGVAGKLKISADALIECGYTKLAKNKLRKWGAMKPDGTIEHIRTVVARPAVSPTSSQSAPKILRRPTGRTILDLEAK